MVRRSGSPLCLVINNMCFVAVVCKKVFVEKMRVMKKLNFDEKVNGMTFTGLLIFCQNLLEI